MPLPEILLLVLCGVMAGADDFVEIARWGNRKIAFLRRLLPFDAGIPSHDTLTDVMNALPGDLFAECFVAWVSGLRDRDNEIVAIDGKTSRRAHWGIENRLHWGMDVVFHDDLMRLRTGNGPANMTVIRHAALNIFKQIDDSASMKARKNSRSG